jgi:hypothetical protein
VCLPSAAARITAATADADPLARATIEDFLAWLSGTRAPATSSSTVWTLNCIRLIK